MNNATNRPAKSTTNEKCSQTETRRRNALLAANPCRICGDACTAQLRGVCSFCAFTVHGAKEMR